MTVRFWLILGALNLAPSLLLADDFSSLEESMTQEQFEQAGLPQLSATQLQFLNRWLQRHGDLPQSRRQSAVASAATKPTAASAAIEPTAANVAIEPTAASAATEPAVASVSPVEASSTPSHNNDQMGFVPKLDRSEIRSNIDGDFNGWNGKTRFKLTNGQVWQQIGAGDFAHYAANPGVVIKPKSLGSWKLYVDGFNRGIKVKRIK